MERLLPPGFLPAAEPLVQVDLSRNGGDFGWARVLVAARAGELDGWLPIGLWTSDERERLVAREALGLGALAGRIELGREGERIAARLIRDSEKVLELSVQATGLAEDAVRGELGAATPLLYPSFALAPDWTAGETGASAELRRLDDWPLRDSPSSVDVGSAEFVWSRRSSREPASELPVGEIVSAWLGRTAPALSSAGAQAKAFGSVGGIGPWAPLRYDRPVSDSRTWRPEGWPAEGTALRLSEAELERYAARTELQLGPLEIIEANAMIGKEAHAALLPPPCREVGRPLIKVLGIRVNGGDLAATSFDELWLLAFCVIDDRAAWYAVSHIVSPGGDLTWGREAFGYPSKAGDPEVVVTPIDCSLTGSRRGREFVYADGSFQGFSTGTSLGQLPIVCLRAGAAQAGRAPVGELVFQQWHIQGRRYRMDPRTASLGFPSAAEGAGPSLDPWFDLEPMRVVSVVAQDGAAMQRSPGVVVAEVPDPEPYLRERCDGVLPWEPEPSDPPQPRMAPRLEPATRS